MELILFQPPLEYNKGEYRLDFWTENKMANPTCKIQNVHRGFQIVWRGLERGLSTFLRFLFLFKHSFYENEHNTVACGSVRTHYNLLIINLIY